MTVDQVEEEVNAQAKAYSLTLLERNEVTEQIYGRNFDLHIVFDGSLSEILEDQKGFDWPFAIFRKKDLVINTMVEYDDAMLEEEMESLRGLEPDYMEEPVNAHISQYENGGYEIVSETKGTAIKKDILLNKMKEAVTSLETSLSLEEADCYEKAEITSESPKLMQALEEINRMAGARITYEFGENTEIVDGDRISQWLSVDEDSEVVLDSDGVKEFVDYLGKTYNTFGRVRTFKTTYGDVLQINGGDYGWWLDRATEITELSQLIQNGENTVREPAYFQTAQQYGDDDIGDTYVEVNLTAQHLFFYKDGTLILESDFVSGNVSKNYGTPTGTYPVQYTETDATLNGEDYSTPVKYWMPFNRNIGFHDASWRSTFGKNIYLTSGSHGCINMPPAAAKTMFENMKKGVAVVVYELPGTENYDTTLEKNQMDSIVPGDNESITDSTVPEDNTDTTNAAIPETIQ